MAGPGFLLERERPPPLVPEVAMVDGGSRLERVERHRGVEDGADRDDALDADAGRARLRADSKAEVPAEREAREVKAMLRVERLHARYAAHDLGQAAGVEKVAVESVRPAVVA